MRIRVSDVLDLYAAGLSAEQILEEMPEPPRWYGLSGSKNTWHLFLSG
jgi:hypothetical protein